MFKLDVVTKKQFKKKMINDFFEKLIKKQTSHDYKNDHFWDMV